METEIKVDTVAKRGAEDSGQYFKYMAEFVGFTSEDAETIKRTKPVIEKHLPEIVAKFYSHLLRHPQTRKHFLKKDGSLDQEYVELRMRHLTNFWLRTADGVYDDDYARYVDYVGRAHTSHGADPQIYIAERYVIGQVGFMQRSIDDALVKELHQTDEEFQVKAVEAWDELMMVILEMLARAYGNEREAEVFDPLISIDQSEVDHLAEEAFERENDKNKPQKLKTVVVARAEEIPDGERKLVQVDGLSIGIFNMNGKWYALRNSCLHRGGPVATGKLVDCTLTCPWHGFQYDVTDGHLLVDSKAKLDTYQVMEIDGAIQIKVPDHQAAENKPTVEKIILKPNEFRPGEVPTGKTKQVEVDGEEVAVYNVGGTFFATQGACTHQGGPLSEGELNGNVIICPIHRSRFNVTDGSVVRGPAKDPLKTFRVTVDGEVARVEKN